VTKSKHLFIQHSALLTSCFYTNPPLALIRLSNWSWFENHRLLQIGEYRKRLQPTMSLQFDEGPLCDGSLSWIDADLEAKLAKPERAKEKDASQRICYAIHNLAHGAGRRRNVVYIDARCRPLCHRHAGTCGISFI